MTQETIVAVYDTPAHAEAAVHDLEAGNIPASAISRHAKAGSTTGGAPTAAAARDKGFWSGLFGSENETHGEAYGRSVEGGATVVSVEVASEHYDHVASILDKHHPVDFEEHTSQYGLSGTSAAAYSGVAMGKHDGKIEPARSDDEAEAISASGMTPRPVGIGHEALDTKHDALAGEHEAPGIQQEVIGTRHEALGTEAEPRAHAPTHDAKTEDDHIQLAEEHLQVGKRSVEGATTRIRRYVTSKPVEEQVTLHDEKVVMDRHPVTDGRVLANADFADETISMTGKTEEAVVSKTARVVEEISLRRVGSDRVETVRDNVRRDEVEVHEVPSKHVKHGDAAPAERAV